MICHDEGKVWGEKVNHAKFMQEGFIKDSELSHLFDWICKILCKRMYLIDVGSLKPDINVDSVFYFINI